MASTGWRLGRWAQAWLLAIALFLGVAPSVRAATATGAAYALPPDAPRHGHKALELPALPRSFTSTDHGWIDFAYAPEARKRVQALVRDADAFRAELTVRLGKPVLAHVHVRVARTPNEMTTLAPEGAPYPRYASGVAYSEIGLVLLTLTPPSANALSDLPEVFKHELAHVALGDAVGDASRVPHWFNEGLAVHLSGESSLARLKTLSTATLAGRLIPLSSLERGFPSDATQADLAYAEAADVVRFLLRKEDRERFPALIARIRSGETFASALHDAYGVDLFTLEHEWREEVAQRYSFFPVLFSGTLVWMGALVLFALGIRKRQRQRRRTLERWAIEEAYADIQARTRTAIAEPPRMRIVLPNNDSTPPTRDVPPLRARPSDVEVPRVQHDGRWHTLH